jgi:hypothetical protein
MVTEPIVFNLVTAAQSAVSIVVEDNVIKQPTTTFPAVSIPASISPSNASCTSYAVSTVLPLAAEAKPTCSTSPQEGNMSAVVKVKFNEKTSFVSDNDMLTFVNSATNAVIGCATFNSTNKLFYATISGSTGSATVPVNVKYYSSSMKKTFTVKSGVTYQFNTRLGNAVTPYELDFSPLNVSVNNGIVTAVMRDTSWTGKYCVNVSALNCTGYNDGQATFCFQRLKAGDCVEVATRSAVESLDKVVQALSISSQSLINSGIQVEYKAGNVVELKPGFSTDTSTKFSAQIGGCNNASR